MAKKQQSRRIVLTSERLNCYGTWLVTAGGDIEQYQKNPVLLYMHRRGTVIGVLNDIKVEGDMITAEPEFDDVTEISRQVHAQYDKGSLRMASVGVAIIEMSDDASLLQQGQTSPTITKWKLSEVSIVDIGANDDAIRLFRDGTEITLDSSGNNPLPKLNINQNKKQMEQKEIALALGLSENATEAEVKAKIAELVAQSRELTTLKAENEKITLAAITAAVDTAVGERKITADKKAQFVSLGQKIGLDELKSTLEAMSPAAKVSQVIAPASGTKCEYKKLSEVPADALLEMRQNDKDTYRKLYRAEYGIDCEL